MFQGSIAQLPDQPLTMGDLELNSFIYLFEVASRTRQQQPTFIYLTLNCLHFYDLTLEQMQLRTRAYFEDYFQKRVLLIVNKFKLDVNG